VIIDEVSMLSAQALDNFDAVARILRGSPLPFGGLRVVLVGDFFQLAPVPQKVNGRELKDCNYQYAFQSRVWTGAGVRNFVLTQVHRQTDPVWLRMLEEIRVGRLTDATIDAFVARTRLQPPRAEDSAPVTHLYATNAPVQSENARALASLPGMPEVFRARDELLLGGDDVGRFLNDLAPAVVELKVGAHVMLLRNLRAEDLQAVGCVVLAQEGDSDIVLANGATGRVVAFERAPEDAARLGSPRWPVVAFPRTGRPTLRVRVESVASEFRDVPGQDPVKARRWQVPLQLCYASSAHKAQGKTILVPIVVKMQDIFAHGQAYVMFSRVPAFDQVFPVDFNPAKVTADPLVVAFSNSLGGTQ
jgi:ATP-dependent DNA helicase PIF1